MNLIKITTIAALLASAAPLTFATVASAQTAGVNQRAVEEGAATASAIRLLDPNATATTTGGSDTESANDSDTDSANDSESDHGTGGSDNDHGTGGSDSDHGTNGNDGDHGNGGGDNNGGGDSDGGNGGDD